MDAILVLMQVGHEGDWSDRGVPEVVTGYDRSSSPAAAGAEWMFDTHSSPVGNDWRLLVWANVRTGSWSIENPDTVVTPAIYRAAVADRGAGRQRRRPKLQPAPVTSKVRADQVDVGDLVLVTQDRRNSTVRGSSGPWFVANEVTENCVAARVKGHRVLTRNQRDIITLVTPLGEIDQLPAGQPVIPVNED